MNSEQREHMAALAANPDERCGCGWFFKEECRHVCPNPASQGALEKAHLEGYRKGLDRQHERVVSVLRRLHQVWAKALPEDQREQGRTALAAAIRSADDVKPWRAS